MSEDRFRELEEKYEDYKVYDRNGEKIGKVDDLFIDESDREEYVGVKMGLFGLKSTLIPTEIVRVNEAERRIEVSETRDFVKDAPTFSDDDEIDAAYEARVREHFGLATDEERSSRGAYGAYGGSSSETADREVTSGEDREGEGGRAAPETAAGTASGSEATEDREAHGERETAGEEGATTGERPESYDERGGTDRASTPVDATAAAGAPSTDEGSSGESSEASVGRDEQTSSSGAAARFRRSGERAEGGPAEGASGGTSGGTSEREGVVSDEGGRTKVRRRIIREEIIEEDPENGR